MKTYNLLTDGITQSLMQKYMTCPKSFEIAVRGWSQPQKLVMEYGAQCHNKLEAHYLKKKHTYLFDKTTGQEDQERIKGIIEAIIPAYLEKWKKHDAKFEIIPEYKFDVVFNGIRLRGMIDVILSNEKEVWIRERKNRNRISEDDLDRVLPLSWQENFYCAAFTLAKKYPKGFIHDVLRYPKIEKTPKELHDKVLEGTKKESDHWFKRWKVPLSKSDIDFFLAELKMKLDELKARKHFYKNQCACKSGFGLCPYVGVCTNNDYKGLVKKELFSELK